MKRLTREWLCKAEEDYTVALGLLRRRRIPADSICFHCQQAAEKFLKAVLQKNAIRFGKTHDLESLARLAGKAAPSLLLLSDDLKLLSDYAVKYRYPGFRATPRQARDAVAALRRVKTSVSGFFR